MIREINKTARATGIKHVYHLLRRKGAGPPLMRSLYRHSDSSITVVRYFVGIQLSAIKVGMQN